MTMMKHGHIESHDIDGWAKSAAEWELKAEKAKRLLEQTIEIIPDYIDGRNDILIAAIEKWLAEY